MSAKGLRRRGRGCEVLPGVLTGQRLAPCGVRTKREYHRWADRQGVCGATGALCPAGLRSSAHPRESGDPGFFRSGSRRTGPGGSDAATKNTWVPAFAGMSGGVGHRIGPGQPGAVRRLGMGLRPGWPPPSRARRRALSRSISGGPPGEARNLARIGRGDAQAGPVRPLPPGGGKGEGRGWRPPAGRLAAGPTGLRAIPDAMRAEAAPPPSPALPPSRGKGERLEPRGGQGAPSELKDDA